MEKDLFADAYPTISLGIRNGSYIWWFKSVGEITVNKMVVINPSPFFPNAYNVGFGNLEQIDGGPHINDMSKDNNRGDDERVLATVFKCIAEFLLVNPTKIAGFYGNTKAKQRLYMMKVSKRIKPLSDFFYVSGGVATFEEEMSENGGKIVNDAQVDVESIERFNPKNSRNYSFVTFELK